MTDITLPPLPASKASFTSVEVAKYLGIEKVAASQRVGRAFRNGKKGIKKTIANGRYEYRVSRQALIDMRQGHRRRMKYGSSRQLKARSIVVPNEPEFSAAEVASILRVSKSHVKKLCKDGRMGYLIKDGGQYVIPRKSLVEFRKIPRISGIAPKMPSGTCAWGPGDDISIKEAAEILEVSETRVQKFCLANRLGRRLGKSGFRLSRWEVRNFKETRKGAKTANY